MNSVKIPMPIYFDFNGQFREFTINDGRSWLTMHGIEVDGKIPEGWFKSRLYLVFNTIMGGYHEFSRFQEYEILRWCGVVCEDDPLFNEPVNQFIMPLCARVPTIGDSYFDSMHLAEFCDWLEYIGCANCNFKVARIMKR
jgi:hypothetical protein